MTTEQITIFNEFLKEQCFFDKFSAALRNSPIEIEISTKEAYLMRVNALLVLNYGFYQNRNSCAVKEEQWKRLRIAWIKVASESNILEGFLGITPETILSAINSVFNGNQFRGKLSEANKYYDKIKAEAVRIQDEKDHNRESIEKKDRKKELMEIISQTMKSPEDAYSDAEWEKRSKADMELSMNSVLGSSLAKNYRKHLTAMCQTRNSDIYENGMAQIDALIELYNGIVTHVRTNLENAFKNWEISKKAYEEKYRTFLAEQEAASNELDILEQIEKNPHKPVEESIPKPVVAVPQMSIINLRNKEKKTIIRQNEFSITYDSSRRKYIVYINTTVTQLLKDKGFLNYELTTSTDCSKLFFRFVNSYSSNKVDTSKSCGIIYDKNLCSHIRQFFNLNSTKSIITIGNLIFDEINKAVIYEIVNCTDIM